MLRLGSDALDEKVMLPLAVPAVTGSNTTVNEALCPALNVRGSDSPLRPNALLPTDALVTVKLEPPELIRDPLSEVAVPTWTVPKLKLEGFVPDWPGARPVPESGTARVVLLALELIVRVPVAAPTAEGAKTTLKVALLPAPSVTGRVGPVTLKPVPVAAALDRVAASVPEFVTETCTALFAPAVTFPKLTLAGLAVSEPGPRPVPESGTLIGELDALETMLNVPLVEPAAAGAKLTVNETLWFELRVTGRFNPLIEKTAGDRLA